LHDNGRKVIKMSSIFDPINTIDVDIEFEGRDEDDIAEYLAARRFVRKATACATLSRANIHTLIEQLTTLAGEMTDKGLGRLTLVPGREGKDPYIILT
jgi:hypothetical protein